MSTVCSLHITEIMARSVQGGIRWLDDQCAKAPSYITPEWESFLRGHYFDPAREIQVYARGCGAFLLTQEQEDEQDVKDRLGAFANACFQRISKTNPSVTQEESEMTTTNTNQPEPFQVTILAYDHENESWEIPVDNKTILATSIQEAQTSAARMIPVDVATEDTRVYVWQPFRT